MTKRFVFADTGEAVQPAASEVQGAPKRRFVLADTGEPASGVGTAQSTSNLFLQNILAGSATALRGVAKAFGGMPVNPTVSPANVEQFQDELRIAGDKIDSPLLPNSQEDEYWLDINTRRALKEKFPTNPELDKGFWTGTIPSAVGSAGAFALSMATTRGAAGMVGAGAKAKSLAGLVTGAEVGASQNAAQTFEDSINSGADLETSMKAANIGKLIGASEVIPMQRLFGRVDKATGGQVSRYLVRALKQGGEEALQEAVSQVANNLNARGFFDADAGFDLDRDILEGSGESAAAGGVVGVMMETLASLAVPGRRRGSPTFEGGRDIHSEPATHSEAVAMAVEGIEPAAPEQEPAPEGTINYEPVQMPQPQRATALSPSQGMTSDEVALALQVEQGNDLEFETEDLPAPRSSALSLVPIDESPNGIPYNPPQLTDRRDTLATGLEGAIERHATQQADVMREDMMADPGSVDLADLPSDAPVTRKFPVPDLMDDLRLQHEPFRAELQRAGESLPTRSPKMLPMGKHSGNPALMAPDIDYDDLLTAVARMGGINREDAQNQWGVGDAEARRIRKVGSLHVFSANGRPLDSMLGRLVEEGYLQEDATLKDLEEAMDRGLRGEKLYHSGRQDGADLVEAISRNPEYRMPLDKVKDAVQKALKGEKLSKREARVVGLVMDYQEDRIGINLREQMLDESPEALWSSYSEHEQNVILNGYDSDPESDSVDFGRMPYGDTLSDEDFVNAGTELERTRRTRPASQGDIDPWSGKDETLVRTRPADAQEGNRPALAREEIDNRAHQAATSPLNDRPEPSDAQKEAGNYKKGDPFSLHGLKIVIENPKGSVRRGKAADGTEWQNTMGAHYGDLKRTEGADGDALDVFVGEIPDSNTAYIIDQVNPDGAFDEHKIMLGFRSKTEAVKAYAASYDKNWKVGPVSTVDVEDLKDWIKSGDLKQPYDKSLNAPKEVPREEPNVLPADGGLREVDDRRGAGASAERDVDERPAKLPASRPVEQAGEGTSDVDQRSDPEPEAVLTETVEPKAAEAARPEVPAVEPPKAETTEKPKKPKKPAQSSAPAEKIEDFGEKIHGARKDYAAKLKDAMSVDIATEPLSVSWPEPDYQKLLDGGASSGIVAFIRAARDEIPTKPQKRWKLEGWVKSVELLRGVSDRLLSGAIPVETLRAKMAEPAYLLVAENVGGRAELYEAVGHGRSLKGVQLRHATYFVWAEKPPEKATGDRGMRQESKWVVRQNAKASAFSNWPSDLVKEDTKEAAIAAFKSKLDSIDLSPDAKKQKQFIIYKTRGAAEVTVGKKIGREYIDLKKFADVKAARDYLQNHADELEKLLDEYKKTPLERGKDNAPRVGDDHRSGAPVTPEIFAETFGFRGVQFGNYVEQGRRQSDLNEAYDGLMDLSAILNIPTRALSLNGQLALAFGARGHGGKDAPGAHYESGKGVINLTKGGGPGALAHEWWHGADNYFGGGASMGTGGVLKPGTREAMVQAFVQVKNATQAKTYRARSAELDKRKSKPYWNTPVELSARAFESYVIAKLNDQGAANDYLANIVSKESWDASEGIRQGMFGEAASPPTYPYPIADEVPAVRAAFDNFFRTVETKADERGNVAMFSITSSDGFGRRGPATERLSVEKVRKAIAPVVLTWESGPDVVVLANQSDLPQEVLDQIPEGKEVQGVLSEGKVYLVAEHLATVNESLRVLAHESVGHFAAQRLTGDEGFRRLLRRLELLRETDSAVDAAFKEAGRKNTGAEGDLLASEALAIYAETAPQSGIITQAIASIRRFLRSLGFSVSFNSTELNALLIRAARLLVKPVAEDRGRMGRPLFSSREGDSDVTDIESAQFSLTTPRSKEGDEFFEQNRKLREEDNNAWKKGKRFWKRNFIPGGLLPADVFKENIQRNNELQVVEFDISHLIATLEDAVLKEFNIPFEQLPDNERALIQESLSGKLRNVMPPLTQAAVVAMRQHIDRLSAEYVTILRRQSDELAAGLNDGEKQLLAGLLAAYEVESASDSPADKGKATKEQNRLIDEAKQVAIATWGSGKGMQAALANVGEIAQRIGLIKTISGNIGEYVHRSYRAFDDPTWFRKIPTKVINDAREYLIEQHLSRDENGEASVDQAEAERLAEVTLHELTKTNTAYDSLEAYVRESKLGAKDLSVLKKRKQIAPEIRALLGEYVDPRLNFAKSTTKMGRLIWNTRFLERVRDMGMGSFLFEKDDRPPEATTLLASDGSEVYAPLNGLWTYPDVALAFKDAMGKEQMGNVYRVIVQLNGLVKYGKTVLSPTTMMRNWQSAMFFALGNGHWDMRHMKRSVSGLKEYFSHRGDNEQLDYLRKLKRLGVVYDTAYAGEMLRMLADSKIEHLLTDEKATPYRWWRDFNKYATKAYQYGDDFWKIIGYENEKAALIRTGMEEPAAETEAAERIRSTYPTYSMVGRGVTALARFPLVGTFVSFPAEIIRTSGNMLRYVAKDFKEGRKELAARRAVGIAFVSGAMYGLQALSMAMFGMDDEEEEAVRLMAAPWNKNSNILIAGRNEDGTLRYFDMSFLDPYNYWKRPINAILRGQPWEKATADIFSEMLTPFFGTDITAGAIFEVLANKKETGGTVYNEFGNATDRATSIGNHLRKALQPGLASNLERTWKAMNDERSASGQKFELGDEALGWVGWRAATLEPRTALYYRSFEFNDARTAAGMHLRNTLRKPGDVDRSEIQETYEEANRQYQQAFREMQLIIKAARSNGMSDNEIGAVLKQSSISKRDTLMLLHGDIPDLQVNPRTMIQNQRKAAVLYGEEEAEQVGRRYREAMELAQ